MLEFRNDQIGTEITEEVSDFFHTINHSLEFIRIYQMEAKLLFWRQACFFLDHAVEVFLILDAQFKIMTCKIKQRMIVVHGWRVLQKASLLGDLLIGLVLEVDRDMWSGFWQWNSIDAIWFCFVFSRAQTFCKIDLRFLVFSFLGLIFLGLSLNLLLRETGNVKLPALSVNHFVDLFNFFF